MSSRWRSIVRRALFRQKQQQSDGKGSAGVGDNVTDSLSDKHGYARQASMETVKMKVSKFASCVVTIILNPGMRAQ